MRVLASDPSIHITRRLLGYLDHQKVTMSRSGPTYKSIPEYPARGCETAEKCAAVGGERWWVAGYGSGVTA